MKTPNALMPRNELVLDILRTRVARVVVSVLLAIGAFPLVPGWAPDLAAARYLNSSEPMCSGDDTSVVMCDDFEDGDWAQTNCDGMRNGTRITSDPQNYAANDGWCLTTFYSDDLAGTNNYTKTPGAANTLRAAWSGNHKGIGGAMMGSHGFPGDYNEIWIREYIYFEPGYQGGHEKMFDLLPTNWNPGGSDIIALGYNYFGGAEFCFIPYKYQDGGRAGAGAGAAWMCQNQSNGMGTDTLGNPTPTGSKVIWQTGHWYYLEVHVRLNTGSNFDGHYNMWMDDCGTDGRGCTGTGTLRAKYNDIKYWTPSDVAAYEGSHIRGFWQENWANAATIGATRYDQIVAATRRIGPMQSNPARLPAPTNLRVQ